MPGCSMDNGLNWRPSFISLWPNPPWNNGASMDLTIMLTGVFDVRARTVPEITFPSLSFLKRGSDY